MALRKVVKPALILAGAALVLAAGAYGGLMLAVSRFYYPGPPAVDYPPPADVLEAREQDLDYFRRFLKLDRSYTEATRAEAEAIVTEVGARLAEYSAAGFQLAIARAVAAADNGHTTFWLGRFSRAHGRLPLRLYWFADGVFVVRVRRDLEELLGARLLAVNGIPLGEAAAAMRGFIGGTDEGFRSYAGPALLELPVAHAAAGLGESEELANLRFELADGRVVERELRAEALADEAPLHRPSAYLYAALPEAEAEPWVALASRVGTLPDYLREPELRFRMRELPGNGLYLQYRDNYSEGIEAFGEAVRAQARDQVPDYIVVDHRFNGGGDYTLAADLMYDLPELVAPEGKVYIVTGEATFSAGINSVAFVKSTGGDRAIIVGERIGDRERIYGETNDFELPNSRLGMTFNTGLHDVENGCPPFPECYYLDYLHDVAVGKLDPDVPVMSRFADYLAGVDPVMEAIAALENGVRSP